MRPLLLGTLLLTTGCGALAAAPAPTTAPTTVTAPMPAKATPATPGRLIFIDLADAEHGIAIVGHCTGPKDAAPCQQRVVALEGGTQWRLRTSPLPDITNPTGGFSAYLSALGPGRAVIWTGPDPSTGARRWQQWFTDDAARTWREVDIRATASTDTIPPGGRLIVDDPDPIARLSGGPTPRRVLVLDPATGRRLRLATQPPLREPEVGAGLPAYDGSWWATGRDPGTGQLAVAVSRNAGRTWTNSRLGPGRAWNSDVLIGPGAAYAVVGGQLPDREQVKNGLVAIYRSTDRGRSWERTWAFRSGAEPRSELGTILAADGSLRVMTEGQGVHVSRDGGRTFAPIDTQSGLLQRTRFGYLLAANGVGMSDETRYLTSTDGLTWRSFVVTR